MHSHSIRGSALIEINTLIHRHVFLVQWDTSISVGILCSMRSLARSPVGYRIACDSQNQEKKKRRNRNRMPKQMVKLRCPTCKAYRFASPKLALVCNVLANAVTPTPSQGRGDMFRIKK